MALPAGMPELASFVPRRCRKSAKCWHRGSRFGSGSRFLLRLWCIAGILDVPAVVRASALPRCPPPKFHFLFLISRFSPKFTDRIPGCACPDGAPLPAWLRAFSSAHRVAAAFAPRAPFGGPDSGCTAPERWRRQNEPPHSAGRSALASTPLCFLAPALSVSTGPHRPARGPAVRTVVPTSVPTRVVVAVPVPVPASVPTAVPDVVPDAGQRERLPSSGSFLRGDGQRTGRRRRKLLSSAIARAAPRATRGGRRDPRPGPDW